MISVTYEIHDVTISDLPPITKAVNAYIKEREDVEDLFAQNLGRQHLENLRQEYLELLYSRDKLDEALREGAASSEDMNRIAHADHALRKLTNKILNAYYLDFPEWRRTHRSKRLLWWWRLDDERFGSNHWQYNPFRPVVYVFIALGLIFASLGELVSVADRVSNFLISVFARSNLANLGLDLLTVGTFLIQIVVGGRISFLFANRLTSAINGILRRYDRPGRRLITLFLPLTSFLVGAASFVVMLLLVSNFAVKAVGERLRASITESDKSISERRNLLELAAVLDPDFYRPLDLIRIGISYEEIGDFAQAQQAYTQALSAEPSLIVTSYLLANLYADFVLEDPAQNSDAALLILDRALGAIDAQKAGKLEISDLHLSDEDYVPQFELLLLVTRAKVFFNMSEYGAAVDDLIRAENIATNNEALFYRWDNKPESDVVAVEGMPVPIRITELYYARARACTFLMQTGADAYRQCALEYWTHVTQLADPRIGREVIWNTEAADARRTLRQTG